MPVIIDGVEYEAVYSDSSGNLHDIYRVTHSDNSSNLHTIYDIPQPQAPTAVNRIELRYYFTAGESVSQEAYIVRLDSNDNVLQTETIPYDDNNYYTREAPNATQRYEIQGSPERVHKVEIISNSAPNTIKNLFKGMTGLTEIVGFNKLNTSNVTDFSGIFRFNGSQHLGDLFNDTIPYWNTANGVNFDNMFEDVTDPNFNPDITQWDGSNVSSTDDMFLNSIIDDDYKADWMPTNTVIPVVDTITYESSESASLMHIRFYIQSSDNTADDAYIKLYNETGNELSSTTIVSSSNNFYTRSTSNAGEYYRVTGAPQRVWKVQITSNSTPTNLSYLFAGMTGLKYLTDFNKLNTSQVTNFTGVFQNNTSPILGTIFNDELPYWNTSSGITFTNMFKGVTDPIFYPNLTNWSGTSVTTTASMFSDTNFLDQMKASWMPTNSTPTTIFKATIDVNSGSDDFIVKQYELSTVGAGTRTVDSSYNGAYTLYGSSIGNYFVVKESGVDRIWRFNVIDPQAPTALKYTFSSMSNLTEVRYLDKIDSRNVVNIDSLFRFNTSPNLESFFGDMLTNLNTASVVSARLVFNGIRAKMTTDISHWLGDNVNDTYNMFLDSYYPEKLKASWMPENTNTNTPLNITYSFAAGSQPITIVNVNNGSTTANYSNADTTAFDVTLTSSDSTHSLRVTSGNERVISMTFNDIQAPTSIEYLFSGLSMLEEVNNFENLKCDDVVNAQYALSNLQENEVFNDKDFYFWQLQKCTNLRSFGMNSFGTNFQSFIDSWHPIDGVTLTNMFLNNHYLDLDFTMLPESNTTADSTNMLGNCMNQKLNKTRPWIPDPVLAHYSMGVRYYISAGAGDVIIQQNATTIETIDSSYEGWYNVTSTHNNEAISVSQGGSRITDVRFNGCAPTVATNILRDMTNLSSLNMYGIRMNFLTTMNYAFTNSTATVLNLVDFSKFNFASLNNMSGAFQDNIYFDNPTTDTIDVSKVTSFSYTFYRNTYMNINLLNWKNTLNPDLTGTFSNCPAQDHNLIPLWMAP